MIFNCILFFICGLTGSQINLGSLELLSGKYNYKNRLPQYVNYLMVFIGASIVVIDILNHNIDSSWYYLCFIFLLTGIISEWVLAKINPRSRIISHGIRMLIVLIASTLFGLAEIKYLTPFLIYGLWLRNDPLGCVHGKDIQLSQWLRIKRVRNFASPLSINPNQQTKSLFNVADFGINGNSDEDVLDAVQSIIDRVGQEGGGIIHFPKGIYFFNKNTHNKRFLQINYSNITIEGETDPTGKPLTEFVLCSPMPNEKQNPWLCPFFITTGESIQASNKFWGLQFRKKKDIITQSNSLSDPGSDGMLLSPEFITHIIADADAGSKTLKVEDSSKIGSYVLIGMYNTSVDGNLLKDILDIDEFRPEWGSALRAGEEEAPSFQWLVGVERIIDAHTIQLSHPLFRSLKTQFIPSIFKVEMLENIHIQNLKISSHWNGLFHHHGFPLYYSIKQSREMDYEWGAINLKRAAKSSICNVCIKDFTNPLYLLDSTDVSIKSIAISGYDGHQGIKLYCHTSHSLVSNVVFRNYYADMMGCEGNAYCNRFEYISYFNPDFHPVDFDFHGFGEGPMSPPAFNIFSHIEGFRYIKGAGAIYNQPSLAPGNSWTNIITEGEHKGHSLFYAMSYRPRSIANRYLTAIATAIIGVVKSRRIDENCIKNYRAKLEELKMRAYPVEEHYKLFKGSVLHDIKTTCKINGLKSNGL